MTPMRIYRTLLFVAISALLTVQHSAFAQELPTLTGRVIDNAGLLDSEQQAALTARLEKLEAETSNQIVVVTVKDLQGFDIAQFGLALGREWGIGQADKDNGALLLVAPVERKVRIEVGRGLEGFLTDATSHTIIRREILPAFRSGDFPAGINSGIDAMIGAIDGSYVADEADSKSGKMHEGLIPLIFIGFIALSEILKRTISRGVASGVAFGGAAGLMVTMATNNILYGILAAVGLFIFTQIVKSKNDGGPGAGSSSRRHDRGRFGGHGGGFGGGSSGGGFSGGGGGFGGGGASGGW